MQVVTSTRLIYNLRGGDNMGKTPPLQEIEPAARQVLYYSAILPCKRKFGQIVSFDIIQPSVCFNSLNIQTNLFHAMLEHYKCSLDLCQVRSSKLEDNFTVRQPKLYTQTQILLVCQVAPQMRGDHLAGCNTASTIPFANETFGNTFLTICIVPLMSALTNKPLLLLNMPR